MTLSAGTRLAHYEISGPLGAGGMGEVYRARDTKLGRDVAIKVLPEDFTSDAERLGRFDREARVLASLNHPHVAAIHGFEESEGQRFLVMELANGETIADRLTKGPIPAEEAIAIAKQVVDALESAHEKGIIHRDLKPANVMLDEDGKVKVLDFGLAKALDVEEGPDSGISNSPTMIRAATHAGMILGTAGYMSPEQAKGKRVDRRADIWAFGVLVFEMLTAQRMFEGETVSETLASVMKEDVPWERLPAKTPANVLFLLKRCLVKDPKKRLQAIGEARILLEDGVGAEAVSGAGVAEPAVASRSSFAPWLVAALFLAAWIATLVLMRTEPPRLTRAELAPPPDLEYMLEAVGPGAGTLSPDGTHIVFGVRDENGDRMLHLRDLGDVASRPLAGTEAGAYPFWSPDSNSIGFVNRETGVVRRIDRDGGPPMTICRAPNAKGGTWNDDDVIVLALNSNSGLYRVPAAGGEPVELTKVDVTKHNSHRHPRFLPDGNHFLFFARGIESELSEVMVGSLEGGEPIVLLRSPAQAEYSNGHLLYLREQALMAQPFDPSALKTTGDAVPVAQGVALVTAASFATFSTSPHGTLAYHTGTVTARLQIEVRDRAGTLLSQMGEPGAYRQAFISPDGAYAVVRAYEETGAADLWIFEMARNLRSRFTFGPEDDRYPIWHPDSERVAFMSFVEGKSAILIKAVGGTEEAEVLYQADGDLIPSGFSSDGRLLLFDNAESQGDLWVLDMETREATPVRQSEFAEVSAVFSPDGNWIAYGSNESGRFEIYVMAFPDKGRRWQVSKDGGVYPYWTADGREIIFQLGPGGMRSASVSTVSGTFAVEGVTELFDTAPAEPGGAKWSVSPDGKTFLTIPAALSQTDREMKLTFNWSEGLR